MQKYINNVQDVNGRAIASARVTVYTLAGALATIYSDDGVTTQNNPIAVNAAGMFSFYAADGRYTLSINANGLTSTISDVLLEDPQDGSDAVFGDVTINSLTVTETASADNIEVNNAEITELTLRGLLRNNQRIVASKGSVMDALGGGAGDSNFTYDSSRTTMRVGPGGAKQMRLAFGNFYRAPTETDNSNSITVRAAIEVKSTGGTQYTYPVSFNGSETVVIGARSGIVLSDVIGAIFPPNTTFHVRTEVTVASGERFPVGLITHSSNNWSGGTSIGSENYVRSLGPSVVYNTGNLAGSATPGYGPYAAIGEPLENMPSVIIVGDSIAAGTGDNIATNIIAGSYVGMARGLVTQITEPGIIIPYTRLCRGGDSLNTFISGVSLADNARTFTAAQWATHCICNLGNNDIAGSDLATIQSKYLYLWNLLRTAGVKVYQVTMFPRTTGTYTTPGGQTIVANYGVGQLRDQVNAWLRNSAVQLDYIDGLIDPQYLVEDASNPGKWKSADGALTADGTHPNSTGHQLIGAEILLTTSQFTGY
jgi:lysophospholipase L1-like esterase